VSERGERLARTTLELVDVPSVSRDEAAIVDHLRARTQALARDVFALVDDEDTCLAWLPAARRAGTPLVLLAGHVDTVPIASNVPGRRAADEVHGRGASDQKAGLAVMLELMGDLAGGELESDLDVGFLFFGREEVEEGALAPCLARTAGLRDAELAIVTEPTASAIEVGCLGNLNARVTIRGTAAHSARPWLGDNAVHAGIAALASIADLPAREVEVDGLVFREVVNVTTIHGGVAANVIPDRLEATVNLRYAPTHTREEAEARVRELLGHHRADVEVLSNAGPAPVVTSNPLVRRLREAGDLELRPKQAWTPVAEFAAAGVDAVNLGPGDPTLAHRDDERVTVAALERGYDVLRRFLVGEGRP
jgi:succinyl-diaminopimelate desuccinylase